MNDTKYSRRYTRLCQLVDRHLASLVSAGEHGALADGCRYVLSGSGKRVRSTLLLLSCEAVGGTTARALHAGAAIEVMHDFTLVHDDIMDNAPSRRGRPAVHVKWNLNNALLVGDTLLGLAYRSLLRTGRANAHRLSGLFTAALIDVCRGQGLDLEFAEGENVTVRDYFTMIAKKTGRLIATATELGGIIGGGSPTHIAALRRFGHYLGRAFQLQDDLLDVVADQNDLGKPIGGDILEGKRTFLLLRAAERARGADRQLIRRVLARRQAQSTAAARQRTIADVTEVYRRYGVIEETRSLILRNTRKATAALAPLPPSRARDMLLWFADRLVHRTS